jgi:hypothetical protein
MINVDFAVKAPRHEGMARPREKEEAKLADRGDS